MRTQWWRRGVGKSWNSSRSRSLQKVSGIFEVRFLPWRGTISFFLCVSCLLNLPRFHQRFGPVWVRELRQSKFGWGVGSQIKKKWGSWRQNWIKSSWLKPKCCLRAISLKKKKVFKDFQVLSVAYFGFYNHICIIDQRCDKILSLSWTFSAS